MSKMIPLNIALIGYGKMGKEIEKLAVERGHQIVLLLDSDKDWEASGQLLSHVDVAIEFTEPDQAVKNIQRCFAAGIPVVCGTTGWHDQLDDLKKECAYGNHGFFYASNFSISVNIFFEINRKLAQLMNPFHEYEVNIEEVHHIQKIDAPSGTAISLANDVIRFMERKEKWASQQADENEIAIKSVRLENVTGTHIVTYESPLDTIVIQHTAKSRRGFAAGAVKAAEFLFGKKGIYTMNDLLAID